MRRFIYYDKDGIESYLAQITSGISVSTTTQVSSDTTAEKSVSNSKNVNSDIGAKLMGVGAEIQEDINAVTSEKELKNQLVSSLEEKIMSDYAFDRVFNSFCDNNSLKSSNFLIGDIVHLKENITFFDFDYFEKLFSENGVSKYTIRKEKEELKKFKDSLTGQQKQNQEVKNAIKEMENKIHEGELSCKSTLEIITMAKDTLPYVRFVMTENCLVTLSDNCFRDDPKNVAFKYGGNIQIVGYVTNIISSDNDSKKSLNVFSEMYNVVNQTMINLYNGVDCIYVIHPLAMFY